MKKVSNNAKCVGVMLLLALVVMSCQKRVDDVEDNYSIELAPRIEQTNVPSKQTQTAFADGDQLGLYVIRSGQALNGAGNLIDNALFVSSAGNIQSTPPTYYADRTTAVDFYSYYPYQSGLANALEVFFGIHTNQTDFSSYSTSDLCRGVQRSVVPTSSPAPIQYTHSLSRVVFDVTTSPSIGGKTVASIESVTLLGLIDTVTMNLATGTLTNGAHRADVMMYKQSASEFSAIVPSQQLQSGSVAQLKIKFEDGATADYYYNIASPVSLVSAASNTFTVTIGDKGSVSIGGDPVVSAWVTVNLTGDVVSPIDNQFDVLWRLPNPKYATVTSIKLTLYDANSKLTHDFSTTNFQFLAAKSSPQLAVFKFDLKLPTLSGMAYPFTVATMKFLDLGGNVVQQCDAMIAANVTRSGAYTIGVEQSIVLNIVEGTLSNWGDIVGNGSISGMVENSFKLQLIEPSLDFVAMLDRVRFRIKGVDHYFSPVKSAGNALLQTTTKFSLPDLTGKIPTVYPYVIEQIGMQRADGSEIQMYDAEVMVTRSGDITLQICRGVVVMVNSTVTGYGAATGVGDVEYAGPVTSNVFGVVYCSGVATNATSCLKVSKLRMTINTNKTVEISGYTMAGTQFSASSTAGIDITSSSNCPVVYPYFINKVEYLDASGVVLTSVVPTDPIKIVRSGGVVLRIME